jgi:hypothetical protein
MMLIAGAFKKGKYPANISSKAILSAIALTGKRALWIASSGGYS